MPNPNPWQARHARKKIRKPGNLLDLQRKLWRCICEAELILDEADDPELVLRAVHALCQCSGQYAKLLEVGEFEARMRVVEACMQQRSV
jgi:hypothetical protein